MKFFVPIWQKESIFNSSISFNIKLLCFVFDYFVAAKLRVCKSTEVEGQVRQS